MSRFQALADSDSEDAAGIGSISDGGVHGLSDSELAELRERRCDEIEAIRAIYGDECSQAGVSSEGVGSSFVRLRVKAAPGDLKSSIQCLLVVALGPT
eukprot:CAMPEP_0172610032 /NCGR_PEP_ID=MMETSP1068-20121228/29906_1 /TAXON_ID=35684 /ORGANISM="Pseudopedinella elastica, Strain CCMP716" /LENGTH=97 /DNA_ID=CAMNT_0013413663 /DNA_START=371 /DNA_END=661 /DNA_ORIENTATION=-